MSRALIKIALVASFISSCGGGFTSLTAREQDQFNRCRTIVVTHRCSPSEETVYEPHCESDLVDRYTAQPSEPERQRWLVRNGCPREMVGTVSSSGSASSPDAASDNHQE